MSRPGPVYRVADLGPPAGTETILHADMDAFYAAVEVRRRPELRGKPVVVGGAGTRGVVAAASYEARRFGVYSAMPATRARRLCPDAVFLPPDFAEYTAESEAVRRIMESYTPLVEPLSLDEAFLDVAGAGRLFGDAMAIARAIRDRVRAERRLPVSVGVAANKFLDKLASREAKPTGAGAGAGIFCIPADAAVRYLHPLPVAALWGVGDATVERLDRLGIRTVADLDAVAPESLARVVGQAGARHLKALCAGRDDSPVVPRRDPKSVGHEETFEVDLTDPETIRAELRSLAERVATRLRRGRVSARTVTLKCRLPTFRTFTRSRTLAEATDTGPEIYTVACELYERLHLDRHAVRLLGISASGLVAGPPTRQLGFDPAPQWSPLMSAADAVRERFGDGAIEPARLLTRTAGRDHGHGTTAANEAPRWG